MDLIRSKTTTLIQAMRILAADIQSEDGVANAAIAEAADRMEELLELVDGAYDIVEIYEPNCPKEVDAYPPQWRRHWLEKARNCGANPSP